MIAKIRRLALVAMACAGGAWAQPRDPIIDSLRHEPLGFQTAQLSKATIGTAEIMLLGHASIHPDCTPAHPARPLVVRQPPTHGEVRIVEGLIFIPFPPENPRSVCNKRKVSGDRAFYVADEGFTGHDTVVLEEASFDGHVRQVTVDVEVR